MKNEIFIMLTLSTIIFGCGHEDSKPLVEGASSPALEESAPLVLVDRLNVIVETLATKDSYRFTNNSKGSVWYRGYTDIQMAPFEIQERNKRGDWVNLQIGWCGTALGVLELAPGKSIIANLQGTNFDTSSVGARASIDFFENAQADEVLMKVTGKELSLPLPAR